MKESIYNTSIELEGGRTLIYNARKDKFLIYQDTVLNSDLYEKKLMEIGAMVDEALDEVDDYCQFVHAMDNDKSLFTLHINPTLDCNFRCWYCYESHLQGSKMEENVLSAVIKLIEDKLSQPEVSYFRLGFFGGEPMLYFEKVAKPIIYEAKRICKERNIDLNVHFTTNAYLVTDEIIDALLDVDCGMQITLDGAKESHDKTRFTAAGKGSYDKIMSNIIKLANKGFLLNVRVNYTMEMVEKADEILQGLSKIDSGKVENVAVDFQQVWQDKKYDDIDAEFDKVEAIANKFRAKGFRTTTHRKKQGIRRSCYGDSMYHVLVNFNGDVFRCTARNFASDTRHGVLLPDGKIDWDKTLLERFSTCKETQQECLKCRVAPLCGGACRQKFMEFGGNTKCIYGLSEADKDEMVLNRFEDLFKKNYENNLSDKK